MLVTAMSTETIFKTYRGVKYTLDKSDRGFMLSTWYSLTSEYIFERTITDISKSDENIEQLIRDGFVLPVGEESEPE